MKIPKKVGPMFAASSMNRNQFIMLTSALMLERMISKRIWDIIVELLVTSFDVFRIVIFLILLIWLHQIQEPETGPIPVFFPLLEAGIPLSHLWHFSKLIYTIESYLRL